MPTARTLVEVGGRHRSVACGGALLVLRDLKVAALFLTRFPVQLEGAVGMRDLAAAAYAFPLVGAAVGLIGSLGFWAASRLGLPTMPGALIALLCMVLATGALHEDGLADTADGLGAGEDRRRALEIMGDSRIGSFGAIAIMFSLLGRLMALAPLYDPVLFTKVVIGAGMVSRAALPVVMLALPSAKSTGLAAEAGRPDPLRVVAGVAIALACCTLLLQSLALPAILAAALAAAAVAAWLGRRLGGCTGDTLGAVQQVAEVGFLFAIVALLA
jgi:adenosylcobinamide-GDP ribazoletransferase